MHVPLYTVQYMCGRAVIGIPGSTEVMTDTHYPVALCYDAVADPGFSRGDAPTPKLGLFCKFFCWKLHENERIWTGWGASLASPWIRQCDGFFLAKHGYCFTLGGSASRLTQFANCICQQHLIFVSQTNNALVQIYVGNPKNCLPLFTRGKLWMAPCCY